MFEWKSSWAGGLRPKQVVLEGCGERLDEFGEMWFRCDVGRTRSTGLRGRWSNGGIVERRLDRGDASPGLPSPGERIPRHATQPTVAVDRGLALEPDTVLQPGLRGSGPMPRVEHFAHNSVADGEYPVDSRGVGSWRSPTRRQGDVVQLAGRHAGIPALVESQQQQQAYERSLRPTAAQGSLLRRSLRSGRRRWAQRWCCCARPAAQRSLLHEHLGLGSAEVALEGSPVVGEVGGSADRSVRRRHWRPPRSIV